jgi:hypothetical protein
MCDTLAVRFRQLAVYGHFRPQFAHNELKNIANPDQNWRFNSSPILVKSGKIRNFFA